MAAIRALYRLSQLQQVELERKELQIRELEPFVLKLAKKTKM